MNVVVVLAKCIKSKKVFGIRIENEEKGVWSCTWTFLINESIARKEGYDKQKIKGVIKLSQDFPGCPSCESTDFLHCGSCKKLTCWNNGTSNFGKCAWCGKSGKIGAFTGNLNGGGF